MRVLLLFCLIIFEGHARATEAPSSAWEFLNQKAREDTHSNLVQGNTLILSGIGALGISTAGYYLSKDIFAKGAFSFTQTLSISGISYGYYLRGSGTDYQRLTAILSNTGGLSELAREEISYRFLEESLKQAERSRKIRLVTHSLTAGLSLLNALTVSVPELKALFGFLGAINGLGAIGALAFESSEEELIRPWLNRGKTIENQTATITIRF